MLILHIEAQNVDWRASAGSDEESGSPKGRAAKPFCQLILAVSADAKGAVALQGIGDFGKGNAGWILNNNVDVILVVVQFDQDEIQTPGGDVEAIDEAFPDRIRNNRTAVFRGEYEVREHARDAVIISAKFV